jgi:hypothetical protein
LVTCSHPSGSPFFFQMELSTSDPIQGTVRSANFPAPFSTTPLIAFVRIERRVPSSTSSGNSISNVAVPGAPVGVDFVPRRSGPVFGAWNESAPEPSWRTASKYEAPASVGMVIRAEEAARPRAAADSSRGTLSPPRTGPQPQRPGADRAPPPQRIFFLVAALKQNRSANGCSSAEYPACLAPVFTDLFEFHYM